MGIVAIAAHERRWQGVTTESHPEASAALLFRVAVAKQPAIFGTSDFDITTSQRAARTEAKLPQNSNFAAIGMRRPLPNARAESLIPGGI